MAPQSKNLFDTAMLYMLNKGLSCLAHSSSDDTNKFTHVIHGNSRKAIQALSENQSFIQIAGGLNISDLQNPQLISSQRLSTILHHDFNLQNILHDDQYEESRDVEAAKSNLQFSITDLSKNADFLSLEEYKALSYEDKQNGHYMIVPSRVNGKLNAAIVSQLHNLSALIRSLSREKDLLEIIENTRNLANEHKNNLIRLLLRFCDKVHNMSEFDSKSIHFVFNQLYDQVLQSLQSNILSIVSDKDRDLSELHCAPLLRVLNSLKNSLIDNNEHNLQEITRSQIIYSVALLFAIHLN